MGLLVLTCWCVSTQGGAAAAVHVMDPAGACRHAALVQALFPAPMHKSRGGGVCVRVWRGAESERGMFI